MTRLAALGAGDVYVPGYLPEERRLRRSHYRSAPDGNPYNNWSTYPKVNPYTGQQGTPRSSTRSRRGSFIRTPAGTAKTAVPEPVVGVGVNVADLGSLCPP
jgi:hypothetical protein